MEPRLRVKVVRAFKALLGKKKAGGVQTKGIIVYTESPAQATAAVDSGERRSMADMTLINAHKPDFKERQKEIFRVYFSFLAFEI